MENEENDKKRKKIQKSLSKQLSGKGIKDEHVKNLIEDYMFFWDLKQKLQKDIDEKGLRVQSMSGNGYMVEKANESVLNLIKVNTQMLKILQDLQLKEPKEEENNDIC